MSLVRHSREAEAEFVSFVEARQVALRKLAFTLTGNWHAAEDLVQTALTKLYVAWSRVHRDGREYAYARQILVRAATDEHRRASNREHAGLDGIEVAHDDVRHEGSGIVEALQQLPPMQRACVVLRHWHDLSVAETAQCLSISEGTVKSHVSRATTALRESDQITA